MATTPETMRPAEPAPKTPATGLVTPFAALGVSASALGGSILASWLVIGFRPSGPIDPVNLALSVCVGPLVALYLGLRRFAGEVRTREALRLDRPRAADVALAALTGTALAVLVRCVKVLVLRHVAPWAPDASTGPNVSEPGAFGQAILIGAEVLLFVELVLLEQGLLLGRFLRQDRRVVGPLAVAVLWSGLFLAMSPRGEPWQTWLIEGVALGVALTGSAAWSATVWPALALELVYLAAYLAIELELLVVPGIAGDLERCSVRPGVLAASAAVTLAGMALLWRRRPSRA